MNGKTNTDRYCANLGPERDHSAFLNQNIMRWCALCSVHKPQTGGTIRHVFGGRHWVCRAHEKAVAK